MINTYLQYVLSLFTHNSVYVLEKCKWQNLCFSEVITVFTEIGKCKTLYK